jgi:hypothetical protein
MDPFADIDLDSESVWLDGAWYARDDLARRIKEMIEAGDFRVARPSPALVQAQVLCVRMPAELAEAAGSTAARLGRPVGHLIREAIAYYLAAAAAYGAAQGRQPVQPGVPAEPVVQAGSAESGYFKRTP